MTCEHEKTLNTLRVLHEASRSLFAGDRRTRAEILVLLFAETNLVTHVPKALCLRLSEQLEQVVPTPEELVAVQASIVRLETLILRVESSVTKIDLPPLDEDYPLCREDIRGMIDMASRLRGDRPGGDVVRTVEPWEVVVSRSEYVVFATEIRRLWEKVDRLEQSR